MQQIIHYLYLGLASLYCQPVDLNEMVLNEQHHNRQIEVNYSDTLVVELAYQAGTGYYWTWLEDDGSHTILKLIDIQSQSEPSRPGEKAQQQFRFSVVARGTYKLNLHLKRQWEDSILRTYSVTLEAD